jgi:NADPH:quinone reductase-like Zn-dependent oxidoreductase
LNNTLIFKSHGGSWQTDNGAYAEYCRLTAAAAFKLPEGMTYEEGASLPVSTTFYSL